MIRKKPEPSLVINSLEEADAALCEIAALNREIIAASNTANEAIDNIKSEASRLIAPCLARQEELERALSGYASSQKDSLLNGDKRRVELTFGEFGFHRSVELALKARHTWSKVLEACRGLGQGVRIKEEVDKQVLHGMDDATLAGLGVFKRQKDTFWYTVKEVEISGNSQEQVA